MTSLAGWFPVKSMKGSRPEKNSMNQSMAIDLTRVGLICDFLAFFLAAPEVLGESGMRKVQSFMRVVALGLSIFLFVISILSTLLLLFIWVFMPLVFVLEYTNFVPGSWLLGPIPSIVFLGVGLIGALVSWLPSQLMKFVEGLSNSQQFRRQLLRLGVLLFILGASAQLAGTF